jgi:hypothetical protein
MSVLMAEGDVAVAVLKAHNVRSNVRFDATAVHVSAELDGSVDRPTSLVPPRTGVSGRAN